MTDDALMQRVREGDDDAFGEIVDRYKNPLVNYLTHLVRSRERAEEIAQDAFVRLYRIAFDDPQVRARGMVVDVDHPTLGAIRTLGSPIKMSETPPVVDRRAPLLGEHTHQVLREAGCSESEIAAIIAESGL